MNMDINVVGAKQMVSKYKLVTIQGEDITILSNDYVSLIVLITAKGFSVTKRGYG